MVVLIKKWQITIALSLFILDIIIGLSAGVYWTTVISRALGWSLLVFCIIVFLERFTAGVLETPETDQALDSQLDITIPAEDINIESTSEQSGMRQIDDDIEEMVRNNPERVAELTRKMGLE